VPETNRVVFVVPEGHPPSGGDLYNRLLFGALKEAGFEFEMTSLHRLAPPSFPAGTEFWVDSLYIPELGRRDVLRPDDRLFFVIHSLPSAEPGLAAATAERLRWDEDRLFARTAGFLVTGAGMRGVLGERGFGAVPVLVVEPAPCVLPKGPLVPPERFTGLIVSSLIRGKGVPEFIEALGREVRAGDDFAIRIAGRTDIEPWTAVASLEAVASHPLLRRSVRHLGFVPYEDLGAEYEKSSALISPSASETFGMAFHEARIFGLPILAVRAPYSEPFVERGRTGLLFETAAELAGGTLELIREPGRVKELAEGAALARPSVASTWADAARSFLKQRKSVL
jgi:glycosyltransferase involved in cell wall biosynthesis